MTRRWFLWFGFDYVLNRDEAVPPLEMVPVALKRARNLFCGEKDGWRGLGYESVGCEELGLAPDATGEALERCLRAWFEDNAPEPTDIVTVWFSGHGIVVDHESGLLLQGGGDAAGVGMPAAVLGELLAPIQRTLVVVDCCHSGLASATVVLGLLKSKLDLTLANPREQLRDAGHEFIAACHPGDEASQLDLVLALAHVITGGMVAGSSQLPLRPDRVVEAANSYPGKGPGRIQRDCIGSPGPTVPVLPNPRVSIRAMPETMKSVIWPKAAGVIDDADDRWRFKGRGTACERLAEWLRADVRHESETLFLVTGGRGAGKSALLSYLVLLSDAGERDLLRHRGAIDLGAATMLPRLNSIDAFVTASPGRSVRNAAQEIIALLEPDECDDPAPERRLPALLRETAATIVVDGVDDAEDPDDLVRRLRVWARHARVIAGCRSGALVADRLSRDAQVVLDLDSDEHYSPADLVDYVVDIAAPDPADHERVTELAVIVERAAGRSFEAARAEAMELLAREELPDTSDYRPIWAGVTEPAEDEAPLVASPALKRNRRWLGFGTAAPALDGADALQAKADELADAVRDQWLREAAQRGITASDPVRVSWTRERRPNTARPLRESRPRRMPTRTPPRKLSDDGALEELVALYQHPDVDKVVIVGEAGAGKSGLLIQLLIEALGSRSRTPASKRFDVPVPVLMTLGDWNPVETDLLDFASRVLLRDYGAVSPGTNVSTYRELVDKGRIALFLDGLDEMPEDDWKAAVGRIQRASHIRVVLTARPEAAKHAHVPFATRLTLEKVPVDEAVSYLRSVYNPYLHPDRWDELIDFLERRPNSLAAEVLSTPLMLSLALDALDHADADPRVLTDETQFADGDAMRSFLISHLVIRAYDGHHDGVEEIPGQTAERHLRTIARLMTKDRRDLAWWRVRRWYPGFASAVLCFVFMLVVSATAWYLDGAAMAVAIGGTGAVIAPIVAWLLGPLKPLERSTSRMRSTWQEISVPALVGLSFGLTMVMVPPLEAGEFHPGLAMAALGVGFGVLGGLAVGVFALTDAPLVATRKKLSEISQRDVLFGAIAGLFTGLPYGLRAGAERGLAVGLVALIGFAIGAAFTRPPERPEQGATPLTSYRRDLFGAALLCFVISATATIAFSIVLTESHSVAAAVPLAFLLTFPYAFMIGACTSQAVALILTRWGLRLRGDHLPKLLSVWGSPAEHLGPNVKARAGFLEDARRRQILRSVGTLYQFRHALLHDHLVDTPKRAQNPPLDSPPPLGKPALESA